MAIIGIIRDGMKATERKLNNPIECFFASEMLLHRKIPKGSKLYNAISKRQNLLMNDVPVLAEAI